MSLSCSTAICVVLRFAMNTEMICMLTCICMSLFDCVVSFAIQIFPHLCPSDDGIDFIDFIFLHFLSTMMDNL